MSANVLNRDDILQADDVQIESVPVPEWGGDVYVKGMTGSERDRFETSIIMVDGKSNQKLNLADMRAKLCKETLCDVDGKKLFTQADVKELSNKSAAALQRVFKVAQRLSGLTDDDLNELSEGLEESPFDDSASD